MFDFFKSKKNHFVGIDFGTSAIKIIELCYKDQKAYLENYGIIDMEWPAREGQGGHSASYEQKINSALIALIKKMKLKSGSAYVSIPGFSGLITIIELPQMRDDELKRAIQFEAHKYIPSSLDEIAMSWEVIHHTGSSKISGVGGAEKLKVLLVAAPKRDIERYERYVLGTNLGVSAIELETFSIARALVGEDSGNFFIIDIGSRATNLILVEGGTVIVNRNIDAGGNEITATICESMNISRQRAEIFKKGEKDILNSKESPLVVPVLEFISSESKRILGAYMGKNSGARIDGIILSGGTSKMKGIEEYFSNMLGIRSTVGDPWRRISTDGEASELVKDLGTSFSVAIGLALRGVEDYKRD